MKRRQLIQAAAAALAAGGLPHFANAQETRPLRILLPFTAGGPIDVAARLISPSMSRTLGRTVLVDNRPGAAGLIAMRVNFVGELGFELHHPIEMQNYIFDKLMAAVIETHTVWNKRVPTPILNRWLAEVQERHPPPLVDGRRLKLRYVTQSNTRPPTFALFASKPGDLPEAYKRYLVNLIRKDFGFPGVPIRMMLRKGGGNPFGGKD